MADQAERKEIDEHNGQPADFGQMAQETSVSGDGGPAGEAQSSISGEGMPDDAGALVEHLKTELDVLQNRFLRQAAEFQNYKRRTDQEKAGLIDLGKAMVLTPALGILDDFSRSLEAAGQLGQQDPEAAYRSLKEGVDLVYRKFVDELARLGVEPIEAVGQPFNEAEHEAMMQQPAPDGTRPGTILAEFQKGYKLGDRVLRHSKVVVAS
jgi:molecular chaperone GrpE